MATPTAGGFLAKLQQLIGVPYVWGGAGPTGVDCSGLVYYALKTIGLNAPRTSEEQYAWTQRISESELRPGDLIFEQWPGDGAAPGHVVVWLGNGKIEQAPQTGELVQTDSFTPGAVSAAGGRVVGYGRIPGLSGTGSNIQTTGFNVPNPLSVLQWPGEITSFFSSLGTAIDWLVQPSHQIRIVCGAVGTGAVGAGVFMLSHVGGDVAGGVGVPRAASLPLGILLTGGGAVLLFVAFHNLPSNIENFPEFIGWMIAGFKGASKIPDAPDAGSTTTTPSSPGIKLPSIPPVIIT